MCFLDLFNSTSIVLGEGSLSYNKTLEAFQLPE